MELLSLDGVEIDFETPLGRNPILTTSEIASPFDFTRTVKISMVIIPAEEKRHPNLLSLQMTIGEFINWLSACSQANCRPTRPIRGEISSDPQPPIVSAFGRKSALVAHYFFAFFFMFLLFFFFFFSPYPIASKMTVENSLRVSWRRWP